MEYCINCGIRIRGRTDKKFCNDHCRSHYHNGLNRGRNNIFKEVNKILKKNTAILDRFIQKGIYQMDKQTLIASEFNFNYFTNLIIGPDGDNFFGVYHYAYQLQDKEQVLLMPAADIWPEQDTD